MFDNMLIRIVGNVQQNLSKHKTHFSKKNHNKIDI